VTYSHATAYRKCCVTTYLIVISVAYNVLGSRLVILVPRPTYDIANSFTDHSKHTD